ncbi:MAG: bmrU [Phycisphaerales bacterium]|nr:bmrU [Phycisphaerales bacterium]
MDPTVLVFANPTSGRGLGVTLATSLEGPLRSAGFNPNVILSNPSDFEDRTAVGAAAALIVIGGDGTLRTVVDRCLMLSDAPLPPILCIGFGTANLMQRHLRLKYPKQNVAGRVVELLRANKARPVDVGVVGGDVAGRIFLLMTSCGYDAGVVHALAKVRQGPITKLSYLMPAVQHLRAQAYPNVSVTVDGQRVFDDAPAQVFVGNVAEYGTGFPVLDEADSADGLLDICVLPCANHVQFAQLAWRLVRGGHRASPGVVYLRGRDVQIHSAEPLPVQIDGDAAGTTPVRLSLLPRQVSFIVP